MSFLDKITENGHWLIRVSLASIFIYHGLVKFPMAEMMAEGMGMPIFMVYMLALVETLGGIFIILGAFTNELFTRLAGAFMAVPMLGAIAMVHWPRWSFVATESKPMGGMEFQLLVFLLALVFAVGGNKAFATSSE